MTIRSGEAWGESIPRPAGLHVAGSDAELARLVAREPDGLYGLVGGDLYGTVGAPGVRDPVQRLPCDAIRVRLDVREMTAVAHVVARRRWWRGPIVIVMNADRLGSWNPAPRAHPNDGRIDCVEVAAAMPLRQRLQARRRVALGIHVPHPHIAVRAVTEASWRFDPPMTVTIDGIAAGSVTELAVSVLPDHFAIHA